MKTLRLPEEQRDKLKDPKGKLFENTQKAIDFLNSKKVQRLVTVGDMVTSEFLKEGIKPELAVLDYSIQRHDVGENVKKLLDGYSVPEIEIDNPAGLITEELWNGIKEVELPAKIIVNGEEDLATIPATLHSPIGSVVAYGQPDQGIVMIHVTEEKKEEFRGLLEIFER